MNSYIKSTAIAIRTVHNNNAFNNYKTIYETTVDRESFTAI